MKRYLYLFILIFALTTLSGCSLLSVPGKIIGGVFGIVKETADVAKNIPWWMWL